MAATHGIVTPVRWTEERKAQLARLTQQKLGPKRVAEIMGLTRAQVTGARQHFRILSGGRKGVRSAWTEETLRALSEEAGGGETRIKRTTWAEIGQRLGKDPDAVRMAVQRWRRENGVQNGRRRRWDNATLAAISQETLGGASLAKWTQIARRYGVKPNTLRQLVSDWRREQREGVS